MILKEKNSLLASTMLAGMTAFSIGLAPVYAQDAEQVPQQAEEEEIEDRIVVTGSRIRRDSFTSTSPLQVIDDETIAEAGLVDVGDILRNTTVVQGIQLDATVNATNVTTAGPGGETVSLRGLSDARTLVMVNGRRMAPAGVEGAPTSPDISLIPSTMIQRVDILLDGASSVYGADAVAGVINMVLLDNYEGFQADLFQTFTEGGGEQAQASVLMGATGDRGEFLFGVEYTQTEELLGDSRDWMYTGTRYGPIDIIEDANNPGSNIPSWTEGNSHAWQAFGAWIGTPGFGGAFVRPAPGATFTPFEREGGVLDGFMVWPFDGDSLRNTSINLNQASWLTTARESTTAYFRGSYDISETLPGTRAFLEMNLANRQTLFVQDWATFDVSVPADNAYNPFNSGFAGTPYEGAFLGTPFAGDAFTARPTQPWRDIVDVELTQYRFISGLEGDLGFIGLGDWDYEAFAGYTRSQGHSRRTGVRENALWQSLHHELDASGNVVCAQGIDFTQVGDFAGTPSPEECIPLNPLDLGLWRTDGGDPTYSTDGYTVEDITNYLRGVRDVTTFVDERILGAYATGPLFAMPAGDVQGVFGFEWRETAIETKADDTAARGLLDGFFADAPTVGSVESYDIFGEVSLPLMAGAPMVEDLTLDLAARFVDNEFYGQNSVYSGKLRYMPTDWLTFRTTYGTSFRAPNLRELFLAGQSFFPSDPDPCRVPALAQVDLDGDNDFDYDASQDNRSAQVIANCQAEGLDPFSLSLGVFGGSVEANNRGNTGLDPETSTSLTAGFVIEQPWFDSFDARLGVSYFDISIEDSVENPTTSQIVLSCYQSSNFPNDPFCQRIGDRDTNTSFLVNVDVTPFNIAEQVSSGIDIDAFLGKDFDALGRSFRGELNLVSTWTDEISQTTTVAGNTTVEEFDTEIGYPEWRATATARLMTGDWTLFWQARYIGEQTADAADVPTNCLSADGTLNVVRCYRAPSTMYHDASISYQAGTWTLRAGVNNVFDRDPIRIDEDVSTDFGLNTRSVPQGAGYDVIGRRGFVRVSKRF
ncbi:MAG: TonB-dependent receptor [Pseudomonadota bacterium]|nr:TonB-dependent receptor [Pseudomonadota bacterium]